MRTGFAESFDGRVGDGFLSETMFRDMAHSRRK